VGHLRLEADPLWPQSQGNCCSTKKVCQLHRERGKSICVSPWGPFLTSPLGANFDPQGRSCPLGVNLSPRGEVIPWGWNYLFAPPFF
jgi:hypothetical protein